ncbi:hypothetical protein RI129_003073 [Pyrocoelia pectoralis]|uniref:Uncharacterized protein n=1 Tax=Pyrocoelia pectoralis TaxID=417401 RepID=A0AAN7VNN9_9COLE
MTPLRETTPTSCCSRQMTPIRQMNPPFLTKGSSSVSHYLSENTTETKVTFHILCSKVNGRISSTLHKGIYTGSILSYGVDNKMAIVFGESENLDNHECNMRDDNIEEAPCVLTWKSDKFHCTVGHCLSVGTLTGTGILMPSFDNNTVAALSFSTMSHLVDANNTKRNYCMFCDKKLTSISRHFLLVHSDQPDIARINSMDKKSRERCEALRKLRTKSNNYFNLNVCPEDRLVVRKSLKTNIEDYLPCPSCSGLFAPKNLAKHNRECSGRVANRFPVVKVAKLSAKYIPEDKPLETHLVDTLIKDLRDGKESTVIKNDYALRLYAKNDTLIKDLRDGKESTVIKNDYALRLYAKKLAVGHRSSKHHSANNRQILRRCARLLIEIQKIDCTVKNFEDVLRPEKYNLIMQSIYNMCIIKDCSNFEFGIPTIANQMNNYLKELPLLLQTEYLKQGYSEDSLQIQRLKIFLLVHEREFNVYISKSANTTMIKNRFKKKFVLPTTEDIVLFNDYIKKLASDSFSVLNNNGFDVSSYATLQKCVLLQLLIFNRRRVGETSRMTVELYLARERVNESQYKYMNRLEIMLAKHYHRMELLGKRERRLPMLLNPKQIE